MMFPSGHLSTRQLSYHSDWTTLLQVEGTDYEPRVGLDTSCLSASLGLYLGRISTSSCLLPCY